MTVTRQAVALVAVAAAVLTGCGPANSASEPAVKSGADEVRTDLDPLLTRFPVLDAPSGARWMSGTFGRSDVPGPSTYWIDAVVALPPAEVERLVSDYAPTAEGATPDVVEGMRAQLPGGPFLTGNALDDAFRHERWSAAVYLAPAAGELVVVATGT